MNPRILNRAGQLPTDGFYQIEASGEHVNHAHKVIQVIDAAAVTSIVNRFSAEAAQGGEDWPGMRIDKDHLSQSMDNPTEAVGWAMELRNRAGIPEARIDWTGLGRPLIEAKEGQPPVYKFFSTEYDPAKPGNVEKIGTRIVNGKSYALVRPLRLDGLSLTNDPNNKGQKPISNRDGNPAGAAENQPTIIMKTLLKKLGLDEGASEESAVAALQIIQNRASQVEVLTTERDTLLGAQVDADLEKYKNRFKPENREKFKKALIANRAGTIEMLDAMIDPAVAEQHRPITNRGGATPPAEGRGPAAEQDEAAKARKISNRANALKAAAPARSFDSCWTEALQEEADAAAKK